MRLDFDEEHRYTEESGQRYPALRVYLYNNNDSRSTSTLALLDTGADDSVFHAKFAQRIGLRLKDGDKSRIGSYQPGSGVTVYYHPVRLRISRGPVFDCEVAFSDEISEAMTDQLIGREVVFDTLRFAVRQGVDRLYVGGYP